MCWMKFGFQPSRKVIEDDATGTYRKFEDMSEIPGGQCLATSAVPQSTLMKYDTKYILMS